MDEKITIGIDGRRFDTEDDTICTADILRLVGLEADAGHVVVRTDGGRAALIDPSAEFAIDAGGGAEFRTFREGRAYHLKVDGRAWEWGSAAILESDVRAIAGVCENDELFLAGGGDEPLRRGSVVDLTTPNVPHVRSRAAQPESRRLQIVVNGLAREFEGPEATFEDLVRVAFPGVADLDRRTRSLTVAYRRGPPERPEGSIIPRQSVRLQPGAVFSVTATDKG